jgi:preprotein translocase subunit SecB
MALDSKMYKDFIGTIELDNIVLNGLQVKRLNKPGSNKLEVELEPNFRLATEKRKDKLLAMADFKVNIKDEKDNEILIIQAEFLLTYTYSGEISITDDIQEKFLETNVPLNSWPYGRELISSITTRMGYPALVIGTFKVF